MSTERVKAAKGMSLTSLAHVLAERAAERPHAIALEDDRQRLTYAELNAAGGRISAALRGRGAEAEETVAVCLPRSWQAVCAFLGVLRAGAAYVPIDPALPAERQRALIEIAGSRLVLTGKGHDQALPPEAERLDAAALALDARRDEAAQPYGGAPDQLAYVLFTSGSSGKPKGVEVTHGNLLNLTGSGAPIIAQQGDTLLHLAPLGFDLSGQEIWGTLLNGGRLVIAPPGRPDPAQLGRLIAEREVTILNLSTGLFHELVRAALPDLGGLRVIATGGDVMSPQMAGTLRRSHPSVRLFNMYGPTEATILSSTFELREVDGTPIPIGTALPGYRLSVRGPGGEPLPSEADGELWIGGSGVARGYRGDPERTAASFPTLEGARMYRTGDRVRLRSDGELLFLGRIDDQVKIDGQRVEPGEVEHALAEHPGLREAAVAVREDTPGHKRLIGYAAPRSGQDVTADELREHLARRLPAFMVPRVIVIVDQIQRNERGKVDRKALPPPPREDPGLTGSDPVATLMAEVLGLDSVGPNEDFFELGGTSLLAIRLVGRLRERIAGEIGIETVFAAPTPTGIAERLGGPTARPNGLPPLAPGARQATAPLSAAQRRAWLFCQMHPDSIAYQYAAIFRFQGKLDEEALREALADLLGRHEILRTSFVVRGGEPIQRIRPERRPQLRGVDLRDADGAAWPRLVRERVRERIDPAEAPLLRWTLARLAGEEWALIHVEHHLVHDGWSFAVLADELAELYSARAERRPSRLPEPATQFQDYARWEQHAYGSPAVRSQVRRWAARLDPNPPLIELPGSRPRPARESFAGGAVRRRIDGGLVSRLRAVAADNHATLFMVALAAFLAQMHRYAGRDDIQLGSGVANRRDPNAERLIGMFVNTVALRFDLSGDPTVSELLARVRATAIDGYADSDAPFDEVVDAVAPRRDAARSPLIQSLFSFHDAPRGAESWSGLTVRLLQGVPNGTAKADLNVVGVPIEDGGFDFSWEHSDLLSDAGADRLAGHHVRLLEQFAARPAVRLSELDLVPGEERVAIERWRSSPYTNDTGATVHGMVLERAAEDPGAVAVRDGGSALTYAELAERGERVAGFLASHGVGRGDLVGVLLGRSPGSIIAQLGALMAGAAYLPLDPQHPPARISAILSAAGVAAVLTDSELRPRVPAGIAAHELRDAVGDDPAPSVATSADDLAYVIYTSGSTGEPKGVEVAHGSVVRLVDGPDYVELGPGTVMLHAASPAFDASTLEVWGPLANGGTVVCLREQPAPDSIRAAIERYRLTTLWLTAGLFHELVDRRPDCLSRLRHLLAGGDVLSSDHVLRALAALPDDGRLTNGYGPTETTTFALTYEMRPGEPVPDRVPIGRPIQGTVCTVLDAAGQEAPIGVPGELAIGGEGVARGYRGDPELTAERFSSDPELPGRRRYLTGDRVRRLPDGNLEFLGRIDRQVKIRGFRVEPAEAERVLRAHTAVADVAVVPYERAPDDLALAAYVVAAEGAAVPPGAELHAHAAARLPRAMVPAAWVPMRQLPLTGNGKLDRRQLPEPGREHLPSRAQGGAPRSRVERRVVRCFEKVLELERVGVEDDFFELGGHSLLAIDLFAELERVAGRRLPLAMIFEASTPRALAARIRESDASDSWHNLVAVKPGGSRPPLFVVAAGDGNIVGFSPLARSLSDEQPLYALQPSGLDGRRPLDRGVGAMADRYLAALRSVQPHGPYLLAGRCNGATVAFELAQRLRAAGESVALLAALDSDPPSPLPFELEPGIPYDPIMEAAWIRAREAGEPVPDLGDPEGPRSLVGWLGAAAVPGVSRYLHEAWHWREDLRLAWPDPLGDDAMDLARWAWNDGLHEMELARQLLLPVQAAGCRTPDGVPWEWALAAAWEQLGHRPADPLSAAGWDELRGRLTEPTADGLLNGYLLAVWQRPDLRRAFPQPHDGDGEGLLEWAWRYGLDEGLTAELLPAAPGHLPAQRNGLRHNVLSLRDRLAQGRASASRRGAEAFAEGRERSLELVERALRRPLPGARWRIERHVIAAAREARDSYRAETWPGEVLLVTSNEFADKPTYPAWGIRARRVKRRELPVGHVEMLRDPGAALLARCLDDAIEEALR